MYTRSYFNEEKNLEIPENYDGNAFAGKADVTEEEKEAIYESFSKEGLSDNGSEETMARGSFSQFFEKLPIKSLFPIKDIGSYLSGHRLLPEKIGIEEVLIIALALYLFFSKDGDKECAILLALLLFIN